MSKKLSLIFVSVFAASLIASIFFPEALAQNTPTSPKITVVSPNGGETWELGSTHTITWTSSGINYTRLDLVGASGTLVTNLANYEGNPGSVSWLVATNIPKGSYKMQISTCTTLPSKDNCNPLAPDVYDLSDSTFSIVAAPTPSTCSSDSDCAVPNPSWGGATFCDGTGLKLMQYRQHPTCQSGTCIYTTSELALKEDCSVSSKICDFSTNYGGQYQCIAGTPPTACPLNTLLTTRCICGSNYLNSYYLDHFPPHYCCGSGSNLNLVGGACPTPTPTPVDICGDKICSTHEAVYKSCPADCEPAPNGTNYTTNPSPTPLFEPPISPTPLSDICGDKICSTHEAVYKSCPADCEPQFNYTPTPSSSVSPKFPTPCNTDQDCSWQSTNSCPESAGASWSCSSLLTPISKSKSDICPQLLSQRPAFNCGCVQNTCIAFEKEKPKEPPKKIGNTEVDSTALLGIVIQMEQLKVKFEFLKSAAAKLANYYNITGDINSAAKWSTASSLLQDGIDKIASLKETIKTKLSAFSIEDLRALKKEVKAVIDTIKEVIKAVL